MRIVDKHALARFAGPGCCELCGRWCEQRDPHHWRIKRGHGGGCRMDHPWNLVAVCRGWTQTGWVSCHDDAQARRIHPATIAAIVSRRENVLQDTLEAGILALWNAAKGSDVDEVLKGVLR